MSYGLVERLRSDDPLSCYESRHEAAARIEQLERERDEFYKDSMSATRDADARIEQLERALHRLQDQWDTENKLVIKYGDRLAKVIAAGNAMRNLLRMRPDCDFDEHDAIEGWNRAIKENT